MENNEESNEANTAFTGDVDIAENDIQTEVNELVPAASVENDTSIDEDENLVPNNDLTKLSQEELISLSLKKDKYIEDLQKQLNNSKLNEDFEKKCKEIEQNYNKKLKQQQLESIRKENILIMRLTLKEQELQDCMAQIEALKNSRIPTNTQLQSYLLDPALNYIFEKMKKEVDNSKAKVEEMQNEMKAWKFSTDSATGKQLMTKCQQLHKENEELGKMISSGKISKLESGLATHKNYSKQLTNSQSDIEEVLIQMEQDIEGFQNTVYHLQQKLKSQNNSMVDVNDVTNSEKIINEIN